MQEERRGGREGSSLLNISITFKGIQYYELQDYKQDFKLSAS